jgi:RimJ/RimL family protein N-acetyltransferase
MAWDRIRYPDELERYESLKDGTQIFFRPVKPTDEPALSEMLYSLSDQTVRTRYFTHTIKFPHKDVQKLTNIDYQNDLAIVGVVPGPGGEEIVAIAQYFTEATSQSAEVAFVVQDEWQQKGMGTILMAYLARIARQRGIRRFLAKVLPVNRPMIAIFHNSGYKVHTEFDGETYDVVVDLTKNVPEGGEA